MTEEKLHIAIISTWFPAPANTSGIFVRDQADALTEAGNKAPVFMYRYFSPLNWLKKKFKNEPLSNWIPGKHIMPNAYNFVNFSPTRFSSNPLAVQKKAFLKYAEKTFSAYIKANGKPDIIHHHGIADFCYITAHLHKVFDIPYVITEHSMFIDKVDHFNPYETKKERLSMIQGAAARITVSNFYVKFNSEIFGSPFIMIPNMINRDFEDALLPSFPKKTNPFYFVNIGSLSPRKCQGMLIKAFASAFGNNKNINLVIGGAGELKNELEQLISSFHIKEQVTLAGYMERKDIIEMLDKSHVAVIASNKESFSMAAAEALFRGNPVLTTRCGGPEDFVDEQNGMICNVNDVPDMQQNLLEMYNRYSSFNYTQIAKAAKEKFSEKTVVNMLENVYRGVLNKRGEVKN